MKKLRIAICEEQKAYREKLAEYFICKKSDGLQVATFSKQTVFEREGAGIVFDIVLFGKGFARNKFKKEGGILYLYLSEEEEGEKEGIACIYKYQSLAEILRQIFLEYQKMGLVDTYIYGKEKEIIAVYSPCQSRLRTPFALTMASICASEKKTLYLNLGEWAGFTGWFAQEYSRDLSDLIYMLSGSEKKLKGVIESVTYSMNQMDFIPPMSDAVQLCDTSSEDYRKLLEVLAKQTDYEILVWDFGVMVPGFFSLLEGFGHVYSIVDQGNLAGGQRQQFEESLMKRGGEHIAEKTEYVIFSSAEGHAVERDPAIPQWLYNGLGDRVRSVRGNQLGRM
ncbi:hypothetical protein FACS1894111_08290 [Clostridia bacterium]|nr:hypothetical protein FACS1894111_08290 [Clostridia bacterium]